MGTTRKKNIQRSLHAVLNEQNRQRKIGEESSDAEKISEIYRLLGGSTACQYEAGKRGRQDAYTKSMRDNKLNFWDSSDSSISQKANKKAKSTKLFSLSSRGKSSFPKKMNSFFSIRNEQ